MDAKGITLLVHSSNYYREQISAVTVTSVLTWFRGFFRFIVEQLKTGDLISGCRDFLRVIAAVVWPGTEGKRRFSARRNIADQAGTGDSTARQRGFIRTLVAAAVAGDYAGKAAAWLRRLREEAAASGEAGRLGDYIRGLYAEAGSVAETTHEGEYHREVQDTAGSMAVSLRHLFIFLRLATISFVRDYITGRFLKSKEEVVIKSPVCREITLDSTLH
jgi:hypothetical protein